MASKALLSPDILRQLLTYDPDTGKLFWNERSSDFFLSNERNSEDSARAWNRKFSGREALYAVGTSGYLQGSLLGRNCRAHRAAWAIYHGEWPTEHIDHVNGVRADNRICNLRQATRSQNLCNRGAPSHNTSGFKGVYWSAREKKWHVQICFGGKRKSMGYFKDKADAVSAYAQAARQYHGDFARFA